MALLDVHLDTIDPMFADRFVVLRRPEVLDAHGRSTVIPVVYANVVGTVAPISPNSLDRHDGYQTQARAIKVLTQFRLQGEVTGFQPDVIVWRGDNFVVKAIDYYIQFGVGHYEVECVSMDKTDVVLVVPVPTLLKFNNVLNSALIGVA